MAEGVTEPVLVPVEPEPARPDPPAVARPVDRDERIAELDYVRGLAVLGILLVNMPLYNAPFDVYFANERVGWFTAPWDQAALWLIRVFAEAKFYTLFSFLFGVGFGVQLVRATARGVPRFEGVYRRRLLVLLFLGLVHQYLFWFGDVLHVYALLGFLLLFFRKRAQKTVLIWALCLMYVPVLGATGYLTVQAVRGKPTAEERAQRQLGYEVSAPVRQAGITDHVATYATGSWTSVHVLRARTSVERLPGEVLGWGMFEVFPMFLLGLWVARSGIVERLRERRRLMRRLLALGLVGFALTLVVAASHATIEPGPPGYRAIFTGLLSHAVARPLHAVGYAAAIVLLVQRGAWARRLAPLAAAGRMAASNYVGQSVICVVLFYGVGFGLGGFGLYGRTGFATGLVLTFAIWAFQLWFSTWWLARYRFGPLEWLWRSLTYRTWQPLRLRDDVPSQFAAASARAAS